MAGVDPKWSERIRAGDGRALARQFEHEARELARLERRHRVELCPDWKDFRRFLADAGPSPGPAFHLQKIDLARSFDPGNVRWALDPTAVPNEAPMTAAASAEGSREQWTMIAGMEVEYADLPERYGVSFAALSCAVNAGVPLDDVLVILRKAKDEAAELAWFSPNLAHQEAFRRAFLTWRLRVRPGSQAAASPKFLYLYMLLPAMAACKAALVAASLWAPHDPADVFRRDESPDWKRFNDLLPKAMVVVAGFEAYRQYSLIEEIEVLSERIAAAELRFRIEPSPRASERAAA